MSIRHGAAAVSVGGLLPFRGGAHRERGIAPGQTRRSDGDRPRAEVDHPVERERADCRPEARACERVAVVDACVVELEAADVNPAAQQRSRTDVEGQTSAREQRVAPLHEPGFGDGEAERKGQADAADRELHAQGAGGLSLGLPADELLNARDVAQCGEEQQQKKHGKQGPARVFEDLFQHVDAVRVRLSVRSAHRAAPYGFCRGRRNPIERYKKSSKSGASLRPAGRAVRRRDKRDGSVRRSGCPAGRPHGG